MAPSGSAPSVPRCPSHGHPAHEKKRPLSPCRSHAKQGAERIRSGERRRWRVGRAGVAKSTDPRRWRPSTAAVTPLPPVRIPLVAAPPREVAPRDLFHLCPRPARAAPPHGGAGGRAAAAAREVGRQWATAEARGGKPEAAAGREAGGSVTFQFSALLSGSVELYNANF